MPGTKQWRGRRRLQRLVRPHGTTMLGPGGTPLRLTTHLAGHAQDLSEAQSLTPRGTRRLYRTSPFRTASAACQPVPSGLTPEFSGEHCLHLMNDNEPDTMAVFVRCNDLLDRTPGQAAVSILSGSCRHLKRAPLPRRPLDVPDCPVACCTSRRHEQPAGNIHRVSPHQQLL